MKQKILLILQDDLYNKGGVQEYTKKIINNFKDRVDFEILYYSNVNKKFREYICPTHIILNLLIQDQNRLINILNIWKYFRQKNKKIKSFLTKNSYNKIINMTPHYFSSLTSLSNYYHVQHNEINYYNLLFRSQKITRKIMAIIIYIFGYRNPIKKSKNIVLYSKSHVKYINNKKHKKIFYCGNSSFDINFIDSNKILNYNKRILYIGRNDNQQKNIELLKEISLYTNYEILFYGTNDQEEFKNYKNIRIMGTYQISDIPKIAENGWIAIMTSNYEGMPGVIMELNSFGIPFLIRDTFTEAKNLFNNGINILIDKNSDIHYWTSKIDYMMKSNINRESLIEYSKLNFSNEIFIQKWSEVIDDK